MPFTIEDAMKIAAPLIAGVVSSYSAPAARAIQGASGAYMAMDEDKRREAAQAQELALRKQDADLRGQEIAASTERSKHAMTREDQAAADQRSAAETLGALLGSVQAPPYAPIPAAPPPAEAFVPSDQAKIAADALKDPKQLGAIAGALLDQPRLIAQMAQSKGQFDQTLAQRKAEAAAAQQDRAANRDIQNRGLASEDAYRKGLVDVRNQEADTHAAAKAGKNIDPEKLATAIDKASEDLGTAQSNLQAAQASNDPSVIHDASEQVTLRALALQRLKGQRSAVTGTSTGAGYLAKLGIGAGQ